MIPGAIVHYSGYFVNHLNLHNYTNHVLEISPLIVFSLEHTNNFKLLVLL
jgi:hypothetical protein